MKLNVAICPKYPMARQVPLIWHGKLLEKNIKEGWELIPLVEPCPKETTVLKAARTYGQAVQDYGYLEAGSEQSALLDAIRAWRGKG
jgi:hypothetical protein